MAEISDVTKYDFRENDQFFIDANVWLFVYTPFSYNRYEEVYSNVFKKIESCKAKIFLNSLVLSEFINRFSRFVYDRLDSSIKPRIFKEFRHGPEFKKTAEEVSILAKKIVKKCVCCDSGFSSMNVNALLEEYGKGNSDFNDQIIAELCKSKSLKLITHDGDFLNCGLDILTANRKMLTT